MKERKIINGALQLRKMAPRSIIGFGKYSDMMVGDLLKGSFEHRQYLAYLYYRKELVSFIDEVLVDLGINNNLIIDKPGISIGKLYDWKKETATELDRLKAYHSKNRNKKRMQREESSIDRNTFSKGSMQRRNHGKK